MVEKGGIGRGERGMEEQTRREVERDRQTELERGGGGGRGYGK